MRSRAATASIRGKIALPSSPPPPPQHPPRAPDGTLFAFIAVKRRYVPEILPCTGNLAAAGHPLARAGVPLSLRRMLRRLTRADIDIAFARESVSPDSRPQSRSEVA